MERLWCNQNLASRWLPLITRRKISVKQKPRKLLPRNRTSSLLSRKPSPRNRALPRQNVASQTLFVLGRAQIQSGDQPPPNPHQLSLQSQSFQRQQRRRHVRQRKPRQQTQLQPQHVPQVRNQWRYQTFPLQNFRPRRQIQTWTPQFRFRSGWKPFQKSP